MEATIRESSQVKLQPFDVKVFESQTYLGLCQTSVMRRLFW